MRIPSFVPQQLHPLFHERHRRRVVGGGCGCGSLFTFCCIAMILLAFFLRTR